MSTAGLVLVLVAAFLAGAALALAAVVLYLAGVFRR